MHALGESLLRQCQAWRAHPITGPKPSLCHVCHASNRPSAEDRALQRYLRNRAKQLGTLLPPSPDAPQPDTAMLWAFLSKQLAAGITNEATVIRRSVTSVADTGVADASEELRGTTGASSRRGVIIAQPQPFPDAARTEPLPARLLALSTSYTSSTPAGTQPPPPGQVHVFWDIGSAHPADRDPRLVAAELQRLALLLGRPAGCYAYANRTAWAWVPSYFVDTYVQSAGSADGGGDGGAGGGGKRGGSKAAAAGRVACPVCGQAVARSRLERHIRELHSGRPAADLAAAAAAAAAAAGNQDGGSSSPPALSAPAAAAASKKAAGSAAAGKGGGAAAWTNSAKTGLGSVAAYYSSDGELHRPAVGHQLSLKYTVQREGFEPRVAQNADGASDRALNGGIDRLLAALRHCKARAADAVGGAGGGAGAWGAGEGGTGECTLVIVSGSERHGAALAGCRQLGVRTVLVAPGGTEWGSGLDTRRDAGTGADAVLDWEVLAAGAYRL